MTYNFTDTQLHMKAEYNLMTKHTISISQVKLFFFLTLTISNTVSFTQTDIRNMDPTQSDDLNQTVVLPDFIQRARRRLRDYYQAIAIRLSIMHRIPIVINETNIDINEDRMRSIRRTEIVSAINRTCEDYAVVPGNDLTGTTMYRKGTSLGSNSGNG